MLSLWIKLIILRLRVRGVEKKANKLEQVMSNV